MAGSKTNAYEDAVLNVLRNTAISAVTQPYVGLFTALTDGETSTITECSGTNYGRATVTFGAPSGGSMSNSADVNFATPGSGGWGVVVGWGVFTLITGGTMYYYSDQTPNKTINQDDVVKFLSGQMTISET